MQDMKYNLQFKKLCLKYQLGQMVCKPKPVLGGLLHRMYVIETTSGKYAVKALNPQIMLRPEAMQNYVNSELIANFAAKCVPALPAKKLLNTFMPEVDGQFYLVFDWIAGRSLKPDEINFSHCQRIGATLADIHLLDFSKLGISNDWHANTGLTDWNKYLQLGKEVNAKWIILLQEVSDEFYGWNEQASKFTQQLATEMVISHRDLDPKNVMWHQGNFVIIDWEAAGYINPWQELTETAIYWSEDEMGNLNRDRFLAFIKSYSKKFGAIKTDWQKVLTAGFLGKFNWLEYNLKRSLWIECTDEKEQQLGTAQVLAALNSIKYYASMIPQLTVWLYDCMND